jgi:hypothetical protein
LAPVTWKIKALRSLALMAVIKAQLRRISVGKKPDPRASPLWSVIVDQIETRKRANKYRRWIVRQTNPLQAIGEHGRLPG